MATGIHMVLPEGMTVENYQAVTAALGDGDPIPGLIFHQGVEMEGRVHVYDVWESRADFDAFQAGRLGATIAATVGEDAMGDGPPEVDEYTVVGHLGGS